MTAAGVWIVPRWVHAAPTSPSNERQAVALALLPEAHA